MSAIASSSRAVLTRHARLQTASVATRRGFASTSAVAQREVAFRFANVTATFTVPSLPAWMKSMLPAAVEEEAFTPMSALAGMSVDTESGHDSGDALSWDGLLHAVPKHKTSHSRKRMRSANKGLKDRIDLVHCPGCGRPKLNFHICAFCYGMVSRMQKAETRAQLQEAEMEVMQQRSNELNAERVGEAELEAEKDKAAELQAAREQAAALHSQETPVKRPTRAHQP